jgi:hypothetical protein
VAELGIELQRSPQKAPAGAAPRRPPRASRRSRLRRWAALAAAALALSVNVSFEIPIGSPPSPTAPRPMRPVDAHDPSPAVPVPSAPPSLPTGSALFVGTRRAAGQTLRVGAVETIRGRLAPPGSWPIAACVHYAGAGASHLLARTTDAAADGTFSFGAVPLRLPTRAIAETARLDLRVGRPPHAPDCADPASLLVASVPIEIPRPTIDIDRICDRPWAGGDGALRRCRDFALAGTSLDVLEGDEQVCAEITATRGTAVVGRRFSCAGVAGGRWAIAGDGDGFEPADRYLVALGLAARDFEGEVRPRDFVVLRRVMLRGKDARP